MKRKKPLVIGSDDLKFAQDIALEAATKAAKALKVDVSDDLIAEAGCLAVDGVALASHNYHAAIERVRRKAVEAVLHKICKQQEQV